VSRANREQRVGSTIVALAVADAVGAILAAVLLSPHGRPWSRVPTWEWLLFFAVFAGLNCLHLRIELGRHTYSVTLVEAAAVPAWFVLPPAGVILLFGAGAVVGAVRFRQSGQKAMFNTANSMLAAAAGTAVFLGAGRHASWTSHTDWLIAISGVIAYNLSSAAQVISVVAIKESEPWTRVLRLCTPSVFASAAAAASLGLITWQLYLAWDPSPVLLLPVLTIVVLANRALTRHRADQLRFERLYESSARVARLGEVDEVLVSLAAEARRLVTASAAACVFLPSDGSPVGCLVDDESERGRSLTRAESLEVIRLADSRGTAELRARDIESRARRRLPPGDVYVVAPSPPEAPARVVMLACRPPAPAGAADRLGEVLGAFALNASLSVLNATLFAEAQQALAHQIDLNRQKTEFLANVSHELRTPLTFLIGMLSTFRSSGPQMTEEQRDRLLAMAGEQGERLRRLIEDLLVVAATEHGSLRIITAEVDVSQVVDDAVVAMAQRAPGRLRSVCVSHPGLVQTDGTRLRQVIDILLDNAVKYAPEGLIAVETGGSADEVLIRVVDHGPGVPSDDRGRIFERFVRLESRSSAGGTGIGLHLARQLCSSLGGTVDVHDTPGGGATFEVRLRRLGACADGVDQLRTDTPALAPGASSGLRGGR